MQRGWLTSVVWLLLITAAFAQGQPTPPPGNPPANPPHANPPAAPPAQPGTPPPGSNPRAPQQNTAAAGSQAKTSREPY